MSLTGNQPRENFAERLPTIPELIGSVNAGAFTGTDSLNHNRVGENGSQSSTHDGVGIMVTGAGTNENRVEHNEILSLLFRPSSAANNLAEKKKAVPACF
jgi:hypothetical protein